jgi:DNA-binding NarL/FixJ family response regulator
MKRATVLIADDHTIVCEGICHILADEFEVVGHVTDGRALLAAVQKHKPDVVVTDISMPRLNGIEAAKQLKKTDPDLQIIFLTMHSEPAYAVAAFNAGASGFVVKHGPATELVTAIRQALSRRKYLTPLITSDLLELLIHKTGRSHKHASTLTTRQREILQLVAEGHHVKEIGEILFISRRTVEFHKYKMMAQLDLHSTVELTRYAVKHGIV